MKRIASVCVAGGFIAMLCASAAAEPEAPKAASQPQAASQQQVTSQPQAKQPRGKDENCVEVTGSRFKRCAGGYSGSAMVSSGKAPTISLDAGSQLNKIPGTQ